MHDKVYAVPALQYLLHDRPIAIKCAEIRREKMLIRDPVGTMPGGRQYIDAFGLQCLNNRLADASNAFPGAGSGRNRYHLLALHGL